MNHYSILIVDDDQMMLESLRDVIAEDPSYKVHIASSGNKALEMVRAGLECDVVVLDFRLPDITGVELAREMQSIDEELITILLTGHSSVDVAVQAIQSHIYDYMTKPPDPVYLKRSIQNGLEKRRLAKEVKRLVSELQIANKDLAKFNEMQTLFLSMVNHDLNGVLTIVKGYLSLLHESDRANWTDDDKWSVDRAFMETIRMELMVSDLVDFSSIEAGKFSLNPKRGDMFQIIHQVVAGCQIPAKKKNVKLLAQLAQSGKKILVDDRRIMQAISNLILNAIKFSPDGGSVIVSAEQDDSVTKFLVKDQGPGLTQESIERIFDQFYQTQKTRPEHKGLGLGLFITREIVQQHGGRVWAVSEGLGKGSTFYLSVPSVRSERLPDERVARVDS